MPNLKKGHLKSNTPENTNILEVVSGLLIILAFANIFVVLVAVAHRLSLLTLDNPIGWKKIAEEGFLFHSFIKGEIAVFLSALVTLIFVYFILKRYSMTALIAFIFLLITDAILLGKIYDWPEFELVENWRGRYSPSEPWLMIIINIFNSFCLILSINRVQKNRKIFKEGLHNPR
jgi:hypothetical protein